MELIIVVRSQDVSSRAKQAVISLRAFNVCRQSLYVMSVYRTSVELEATFQHDRNNVMGYRIAVSFFNIQGLEWRSRSLPKIGRAHV